MAAATVSGNVIRESLGSLLLHIITFSNIDDTNTYASGIKRVVGYWGNLTNDGTQEKESMAVRQSDGTFTISVGENSKTGKLYVVSERTV